MLDTLKYAKRLQAAGFTPPQAEAQAQALWEAIEGTVATKQDILLVRQELQELETRLNGRIDSLEARIDGRIGALEARIDGRFKEVDGRFRLLYWMVGFNLALTVAVLIKLLTV